LAPNGSDSNPGTITQPFATLQKGANVAVAGDTVWIRGGTYQITTPNTSSAGITLSKSGTSDTNRIKYWAYPGEIPVFDFSNMVISTTGYTHGLQVSGSWLHIKGLELCNIPENTRSNNAVNVTGGGNDIFELLNMHHNQGNGIFIGKGTGGHLVLNCDAHDNYDPTSAQGAGQNADGFGVHYQTSGAITVLRGCRGWWNSDDGYDLINQEVPVTVENSWAMGNGYANYGTTSPASGNGNGFKMGSSATGVRHLVQNNLAWRNKAAGFYANHSSGGNTWYNNTSYNNGTQYNMLASPSGDPNTTIILTGDLVHIMRNNIGFPNKNANMGGVDTAFNSWDLNITPSANDFLSVSDPSVSGTGVGVESSGALGPRAADGSLPNIDFMKLRAGSQMIDKGQDVGLPFVGAAPDLGCFEYGAAGSSGGGGSGGTGTGGAATGGTASGGKATGGSLTGGSASGGKASGGASTGGTSSGGTVSATGGSPGTGGIAPTGGVMGSGGVTAAGGSGGSATATGGSGTGGSGEGTETCNCRVASGETSGHGTPARLALLGLALASWLGCRRRDLCSRT
jgi:hypothetical protein